MRRIISLFLTLCLALGLAAVGGHAVAAQLLDDQIFEELTHAIFEANQLETLFSRHKSLTFRFTDPKAPDGYDTIWETEEIYFQSYADWFAHWEQDQLYYEMRWDSEADSFSLTAGYDYDAYYSAYCFVSMEEELWDREHDRPVDILEENGRIVLTTQHDESLSRETMEDLGLEYAGESVISRLVVDAETYEIVSFCKYTVEDGQENVVFAMEFAYDRPEPLVSLVLRAAFERDDASKIDLTYVIDPGTDREIVKTMTVPANTNCWFSCDSVPFVYFYDQEQTVVSGWDRMSDLTVYIYTDPSEELGQRFLELYSAAIGNGLVLRDSDGNVLEDGTTLSGQYYYKVYVEGVPEEYEGIQTAWVRDVLDAEEPADWETFRYLYEDEIGRYILVVPVVGGDYIQETMFARLDENDPNLVRINFLYDRETVRETEPPALINEEDPKVGQTDFVLQWEPVEGAEFYEVLWYTPSGNVFYYGVTEPEFFLSDVEGALEEAGEYTLYILPYGDGIPFTYGAWTSQVTE